MLKPTLFAALLALGAPGCAGYSFVVTSAEGVAFTHAEALDTAQSLGGSRAEMRVRQTGGFKAVKVRRVTASGIELYSGGLASYPFWTVRRPEVDEGLIAWSSIRQVRVRPWIFMNILCWGTLFIFYPSFYNLDLEDASGQVVLCVAPIGSLLREVIPLWLVLSNRAYCRHIAQAVMFLAGGGKRPGAGPRAP